MKNRPSSARTNPNWSALGSQAVSDGDVHRAKDCFTKAVKLEKDVAAHRFHLAIVLEALGDFGGAAEQLTTALRLKPDMADATRRLGSLVSKRPLPKAVDLDVIGLRSALQNDVVNRDQIAEIGVYFLSLRPPLKDCLEQGRTHGWLETARQLVLKKTAAALKDELLVEALRHNLIRMPDLERLLVSLRRVILLEVADQRFTDRHLVAFTVALAQQCWINEFVWPVAADEDNASQPKPDRMLAALDGDAGGGVELLRASLYQPVTSLLPRDVPVSKLNQLVPQMLADFARKCAGDFQDEAARLSTIPEITAVKDATSTMVSGQYSQYPYPRWSSLGLVVRAGEWKNVMGQHFDSASLAFMDRPFEVLIAGCGTGIQAIAAAHAYGPNARVTAIDISKPSLAYAARMAEHFHAKNITFALADINDIGAVAGFAGRFQVVECVGVLHHMADPMAGWRSLLACCAPGGKMLIGLYSEIARRGLTAMKSDPAYPGVGCSDTRLREFRQNVLARPLIEGGLDFKGIRDVYSTSGFRDLLLHVSEKRHTIPEIQKFLDDQRLTFRGFMNSQVFERLTQSHPHEVWPGRFEAWTEFENANPMTFTNMYRLWCEPA